MYSNTYICIYDEIDYICIGLHIYIHRMHINTQNIYTYTFEAANADLAAVNAEADLVSVEAEAEPDLAGGGERRRK